MRTVSMNDMVDITLEVFNEYIEPVACSFMYGEVPTSTIMIHRTGTYDHDYLTKVRFKNTTSISIFRCEIFMQDVLNLCRICKLYLVTPEIFTTVITYSMLFPLYQSQHMDFDKVGVDLGYDQMMTESGNDAYKFMLKHFNFPNQFNRDVILKTIHYTMMDLNQTFKYFPKNKNIFDFLDAVFERNRNKCFSLMNRLDQDASSSLALMMNNFVALYYMKIFPPQSALNDISKITKIPAFILTKKKNALKLFSLSEIVNIISQISYLNTLSVSAPNNIFKARFELMLFNITK